MNAQASPTDITSDGQISNDAGVLPDARPTSLVLRLTPPAALPFVQLARLDRPIGWQLLLAPCWQSAALNRSLANVLLAEAGVPYDLISDLDEINAEFETADVALIIGANDVVNPDARTNKGSPIYGMPILNADKAKNVIVIKRGQGQGFSGIDNALFVLDQTRMLYGDAQAAVGQLIQAVKAAG